MVFTLSTTWATTKHDYLGGNGGLASQIVLTFPIAASTKILQGEFLKLSSGYVTPCTATSDKPVGVAMASVDNTYKPDGVTASSAGDLNVPVMCRGIVQVNAFVAASGTYDDALVPFTRCGLSSDGTNPAGQTVSCGADPSIFVGKMLSTAAGAAGVTYLALIYLDCLGNIYSY